MIFLTEGDSAAGSLEVCRDVNCQAIFALRGKPMNCYGEKFEKIYTNEELTFLMQALGIEDSTDFLRYDKGRHRDRRRRGRGCISGIC